MKTVASTDAVSQRSTIGDQSPVQSNSNDDSQVCIISILNSFEPFPWGTFRVGSASDVFLGIGAQKESDS